MMLETKKKYTPIKCYKTKASLYIGDYVEDLQKRCGTLEWDEDFNIYYIKPIRGGKIKTQQFIKINKLYNYLPEEKKLHCKTNSKKRKW